MLWLFRALRPWFRFCEIPWFHFLVCLFLPSHFRVILDRSGRALVQLSSCGYPWLQRLWRLSWSQSLAKPREKQKITFLRVIPTMTCQDMSGHIFGHILNTFWHSIWQSIWHIFWPSTWLGIWHSIWHSFESRNKTKQQLVLVSRFVSFLVFTKHRMHKADAYTSGISNRLVDSTFVWSFCQGTLPN